MPKISKSQAAFNEAFVGPRLNGTQRARALRLAFKREFNGPPKPYELVGKKKKGAMLKEFRAAFVGPRVPTGTKAYQRIHSKKHYRENRAARHADARNRKEAKRNRIPSWFGEFDRFVFEEAHALALSRKTATGIDWQIDHMIPLRSRRVSGLHIGINASVIPAAMNAKKGNRLVLTETGDWLR